jgi:type II secretory pathway pseudopilin PulG
MNVTMGLPRVSNPTLDLAHQTRRCRCKKAFTRIELLAVCAALLLLALAAAPAAVSGKPDAERLICFNNLRLIGRAVQEWAADFKQETPWRTLVSDGGTRPDIGNKPGVAWNEFSFLSNQLVTPKILTCPSDAGVIRARDFNIFRQASYRQNALSYTISLDGTADLPRGWLSSDRNLRPDSYGATTCSAGVTDAGSVSLDGIGPAARWTNGAVHGQFGHMLLLDGTVEFTSTARWRELLGASATDYQNYRHFLKAR